MARAPRIVVPGETYHVFSRGSNRSPIFFDDLDYSAFLLMLARLTAKYAWRLYAYCLMPNHVHLLLRVSDLGLSDGMRELNGGFSRRTNCRYGRTSHLFQNRFGDTWVKSDDQLVQTLRYVVLNPIEAGLCGHPSQWRWSSYHASVGLATSPAWLDRRGLLSYFEQFDPADPVAAYSRFVEKPLQTVSDTVAGV